MSSTPIIQCLVFLLLISCSPGKKTMVACPDLNKKNSPVFVAYKNSGKIKSGRTHQHDNRYRRLDKKINATRKAERVKPVENNTADQHISASPEKTDFIVRAEISENLLASSGTPLILNSPEHVAVEFKNPDISGTVDRMIRKNGNYKPEITVAPADTIYTEKRMEPFAVIGLSLGILGLVTVYGILPFGIVSLVFGVIGLRRIKKYPEKYRGKWVARLSIIAGIISLVGVAAFIISWSGT